jgi:hypothetical protein
MSVEVGQVWERVYGDHEDQLFVVLEVTTKDRSTWNPGSCYCKLLRLEEPSTGELMWEWASRLETSDHWRRVK